MQDFTNYLKSFKSYTIKTCLIYTKYAKELVENQLDYNKALLKYINNSNNTKRIILSSFRNYYKFIGDKRMHEITLPKKDKKIKDFISYDEYLKIISYLENKKKINYKKILIFKLLFETGIRSSELLLIKKENIDENKILINGKNNKQRIIYVSNNLLVLIKNIIFNNKNENNNYLINISYKTLYKKIRTIGLKVLNKKISPHMFRRGFATYCINKNIGIYELSLMMGHENINTTKSYIRSESKIENMKNIFN